MQCRPQKFSGGGHDFKSDLTPYQKLISLFAAPEFRSMAAWSYVSVLKPLTVLM